MKSCLGAVLLLSLLQFGWGLECYKKVFGLRTTFDCPTILDRKDEVFCCTNGDSQRCCSNPLDDEMVMRDIPAARAWHHDDDDDDNFRDYKDRHNRRASMALGSILATIAAVIGAILVICCLCCCFCPFCILYKRRQRGAVYRTTVPNQPNVTVTLQPNYPPQSQMPMGPPHPGYPPHMPPGTQQGPPANYQMPMPYPGEQPPPYPGTQEHAQKQSAYNPYYK